MSPELAMSRSAILVGVGSRTSRRADAVVVGAPEAGHWRVGSLAGRLVRAVRWPVTVVP